MIFLVHGWPKITGGKKMAEMMAGTPNPTMATVFTTQGAVEVAGGVLLAVGIITQIVAIPLAIIMIGAIVLKMTRFKTGFFSQATTGWEFDLVILAGLLLLFLAGPGELAVQS